MYTLLFTLISLWAIMASANVQAQSWDGQPWSGRSTTSIATIPLSFTENQGQWGEQVEFRANYGKAIVWFTSAGVRHQFIRPIGLDEQLVDSVDQNYDHIPHRPEYFESLVVSATFINANPHTEVAGENEMSHKYNYFIGSDPDKWKTDVPSYRTVVYKNIYEGIDAKYYEKGGLLEYDLIVSPGADHSQIEVRYDGSESVTIDEDGRLVVHTLWGEISELRPTVYQVRNGDRVDIDAEFRLKPNGVVGFELYGYDSSRPITIDPVIAYSTYVGGSSLDYFTDIAIDDSDQAHVTGFTSSFDFPHQTGYQTHQQTSDSFVAKLDDNGDELVYCTIFGGGADDTGHSIELDSESCVYITGLTQSINFPVLNAFQPTFIGFYDGFVTKLSSRGNELIYSSYLGGMDEDRPNGIAVDGSKCAVVVGYTESSDFPIERAIQNDKHPRRDAFVTKINRLGDALLFSTFLGGDCDDMSMAVAVDEQDNTYVTGMTCSSDFYTEGAYQDWQGAEDAFVLKLNKHGDSIAYSTFLGGSYHDWVEDIDVDINGCAYVTGYTWSVDFPTTNAYQSSHKGGYWDGFVTCFNQSGSELLYSTFLGGSHIEMAHSIALDEFGNACVAGYTNSTDFPMKDALQPYMGVKDGFLAKLTRSGNALIYSTYFGGTDSDRCNGVAVGQQGSVYLTGYTYSTDFPTLGAFQDSILDSTMASGFVTKLVPSGCCGQYTGGLTGNCNCSVDGKLTLSDVTALVDNVYVSKNPLCCQDNGNVDASTDGSITLADITRLIDAIYVSKKLTEPCW